jgi:hypothetical protein
MHVVHLDGLYITKTPPTMGGRALVHMFLQVKGKVKGRVKSRVKGKTRCCNIGLLYPLLCGGIFICPSFNTDNQPALDWEGRSPN